MNYSIHEMPESHLYSEMEYGNHGKDGKAIFLGETLIAYVWFYLHPRTDKTVVMSLEMIEVIEKGKGHGTGVISFLFEYYGLEAIEGSIFLESSARPYYFWSNLGADCDVDNVEEYLSMYEQGFDVCFTLKRNHLVKETVLEGVKTL